MSETLLAENTSVNFKGARGLCETIPPARRAEVLNAAVYSTFIDSLPLFVSTLRAVQHWDLDEAQIWRYGIRPCPTFEVNQFVTAECYSKYGDRVGLVPGFFCLDRLPCDCKNCDLCEFEWTRDCICARKTWRVDLDPKLSTNGLLVPERSPRGLIQRVWVFRWHGDRRPFPLALRREAVAA